MTDEKHSTDEHSKATSLEESRKMMKLEKRLVLKQDLVIMPFAFLLYVSAYLDRSNLGNARLQGLQKDALQDDDTKYSLALSCFYISYILFAIPGTLLAKHINPSTSIGCGAFIWSCAVASMAAATNPGGIYTCRVLVGLGEAMFGQAMVLYLSMWYTRYELSQRLSFYLSAGALAGAFGGVIAYGVARIPDPAIAAWRVLMLVEGLPTVLLAFSLFFFLPARPAKSLFLTENQRALATKRLADSGTNAERDNGIEMSGVKRAFIDPKCYIMAVLYSCINLTLSSIGGFLPTIIKGLGYSKANAQLFTVPPYAAALVLMLLLASFSDRKQTRGIPIAVVFCIGILGWSLLYAIPAHNATSTQLHWRYFGCVTVVISGYAAIPLLLAWVAANSATESQRAVALGMLNTIGQCLSVLGAFSFPSKQGPQFHKGITLNIAFQAVGCITALCMSMWFRYENRRRDATEDELKDDEEINTQEYFDLAKGFRYVV